MAQLQRTDMSMENPQSCQDESGRSSVVDAFSRATSTLSDCSGAEPPKLVSQMLDIGEEIAMRREGEIMGEMSLLTGQRRTATVVAATECTMISMDHSAIRPLLVSKPELAQDLAELVHSRLSNKPFTSGVTLRLHQAISCGKFWFACMGGAEMSKHVGARREFLIIGIVPLCVMCGVCSCLSKCHHLECSLVPALLRMFASGMSGLRKLVMYDSTQTKDGSCCWKPVSQ